MTCLIRRILLRKLLNKGYLAYFTKNLILADFSIFSTKFVLRKTLRLIIYMNLFGVMDFFDQKRGKLVEAQKLCLNHFFIGAQIFNSRFDDYSDKYDFTTFLGGVSNETLKVTPHVRHGKNYVLFNNILKTIIDKYPSFVKKSQKL